MAFDPPKLIELQFRDGKRQVPEYLAVVMTGIETYRMTYDDAVGIANKRMEADHLNAKRDEIVAAHFRELRDGLDH